VDPKIDKETEALLASGSANGEALQAEERFDEGIVATTKRGDRVFLPNQFLDLMRYRNRGKD
jgi:hypothetical protein